MVHEIQNFYGCYCLVSANPRFKGWTYIGFTVDPNRRVQQHNIGKEKGGAWRTSGKGPWDMVLIVHGFPSMVSALQFEWAWQNPHKSKKLKHVADADHMNKRKARGFKFRFNVLSEMLRTGPWNRLPLSIRWLKQDFAQDFDVNRQPPVHMPIVYGPIKSKKRKKTSTEEGSAPYAVDGECCLCNSSLTEAENSLSCIYSTCQMKAHLVCLAQDFLHHEKQAEKMLLPVMGDCPICGQNVLWGDLIRKQQGCLDSIEDGNASSDGEYVDASEHWGTQLAKNLPLNSGSNV